MKTFIRLLLLLLLQNVHAERKSACFFPESELRPFFYEVSSDIPVGTTIVDTVVDPPDARIVLASVRSNAFPALNFTSRFSVTSDPSTGHFSLSPSSLLSLPSFPSSLTETYLYITVVCNEQAYPLITVRVSAANTVAPQFYAEPYVIHTKPNFQVGSIIDLPITAIDWDPSQKYNVSFHLEDSSAFELLDENEKYVPHMIEGAATWPVDQLPPKMKMRVVQPVDLPTTVKIVAADGGSPPRSSKTSIKLVGQPKKEQSHFKAHASKIKNIPSIDLPKGMHLEPAPPTFTHCHISVNLAENSPNGTPVTILKLHNRQPDTEISLVDPDGTFFLDQEGVLTVADNRLVDREMFSTLEVVAEIKNADRLAQCGRIRVRVVLQDENDNRPVFEKEKYWFHLSEEIAPGAEFGTLKARDIDEVENGHVSYRLLTSDAPFKLRVRGRDAALVTTGPIGGVDKYELLVEARDHGIESRSTNVTVDVFVLVSKLQSPKTTTSTTTRQTTKTTEERPEPARSIQNELHREKVPIRGVASVTSEPLPIERENRIFNEDHQEHARIRTQNRAHRPSVTTPPSRTLPPHPTLTNQLTDNWQEFSSTESSERFDIHVPGKKEPFHFTSDSYFYEVYGSSIEDDIVGRVVAEPNPQMYGIDRKAAGIFKVDPDIGELSIGHKLYRQESGNITFKVSATNGLETAETAVTIFYAPENNRNDAVPRFDQTVYKFSVRENTRPEVIGIVRAFHLAASSRTSSSTLIKYDIISEKGDLPFSVHQLSGEVANEIELDHEFRANYNFKIRACLSDAPTNCGVATVLVSVEDLNDNSPRFSASLQNVNLPSDLAVGAEVIRLHATDADDGSNGDVSYAITPPSATFAINYDTGSIVTVAPLTNPRYSILVEAFDHGIPKRSDVIEIRVVVQGTNPSAPVFDKNLYEVVLTSPVRAGSVVGEVRATDPDPGEAGQVNYKFARTNDPKLQRLLGKLQINEKTGVISAVEPLSSLDGPIDLVIEAEDQSLIFHRKATTNIHVELFGDSSLRFLPLPVTIYISTEKALGSVILRASTLSSSRTPVSYSILEDNSPFVMDGDLLRVATHLMPGHSHLTLLAETDSAHVDHKLNVVVMADRDKYPVFPQLTYDIDIPLEARFPLTVHRFDASLSKGDLQYELFPPAPTPTGLILDENSGELIVTSDYAKDASNHDTIFIVVRAKNTQFPEYYSDVGVALSLVSQKPSIRFPQTIYRIKVQENTPIGTIVGPSVEIFPKDSSVVYSILPNSLLGVHPNGSVWLKNDIDLESIPVDKAGTINFVVTAMTSSDRTTAKIQLRVSDENEFSPQVAPHLNGRVRENSAPGTAILRVNASDQDFSEGSHLSYKIVGGSGRGLVFIQEDGTLILGDTQIDREKLESFDVEVDVIDRGGNKAHSSVHVEVEDENDNPPKVQHQPLLWNVTEGALSSSFPIVATDEDSGENGAVTFRIIQGNEDGFFRIVSDGPSRASLHLIRPLDFEDKSSHVLTLEARDGGTPSQFAIVSIRVEVVNVNDNTPKFTKEEYFQKVPMDLPVGFPVITVAAIDEDHNNLTYDFKGIGCDSFTIDGSGVISFKKIISQREEGTVKCEVEVSDGVHVATVPVDLEVYTTAQPTVPSANRAPTFGLKKYNFALSPDMESTESFGQVTATDPDGDQVLYSIRPAEYRNLFDIDAEGSLRLKVPYTELSQPLYSFLVNAEDWGPPIMSSLTNVNVHVTEISPFASTTAAFSTEEILMTTVSEFTRLVEGGRTTTAPVISESTRRTTSEPTRGVTSKSTERVTSETTRGVTSEGTRKVTGESRTEGVRKEDNPLGSTEQIGPAPTTVPIIKFFRPSYMYSVRSDSPLGTYLGQVRVTYSKDVEYSMEDTDYFDIDSKGRVHTARTLDVSGKVNGTIVATYRGDRAATVPIVVHVIQTTATSPISTSSSVTTATSQPTTSRVSPRPISRASTHASSSATMHEASVGTRNTVGSFSTATSSVRESTSTEPLTRPTSPTTSQSTLAENTDETSATVPFDTTKSQKPFEEGFEFERKMYFGFVPEGNYGNGIEVSVKPEKIRTNFDGKVRFTIANDSQALPFFVTEDGQLIVFDMDREERSSYMVEILAATDTSPPQTATSHINITVLDVNDNYPTFESHPQILGLYADVAPGTTIYQFEASDADADLSGQVHFELDPANQYFEIDTIDGSLKVTQSLTQAPREQQLTITARDLGRPALKTHHRISIRLFDRHSPAPRLPEVENTLVVPAGSKPGTVITTLLAGPNVGENSHESIRYGLTDNYAGLFEMTEDGELVLTREPTESELAHIHQLHVTAENSLGVDSLLVNVLLEGTASTTTTTSPPPHGRPVCTFSKKLQNYRLKENEQERQLVARLRSSCPTAKYSLEHAYEEFEIVGDELWAIRPLDRERKSLYFLYINAVPPDSNHRVVRENPLIENAKSKLKAGQMLVVVRVLDENDNAPSFVHLTDGKVISNVDGQSKIGTAVTRIQAKDIDERADLSYSLTGADSDLFSVNASNGLVTVDQPLKNEGGVFEFTATATDGLHVIEVPIIIYKLSTSSNIVRLTSELAESQVNEYDVERTLNELIGSDSRVLAKQEYVDEKGNTDPFRSHIFVYSVDRGSKQPYGKEKLVSMLSEHSSALMSSPARISDVSVMESDSTVLSGTNILVLVLALLIVLLTLLLCCFLASYWRKKRYAASVEHEYMVDSVGAGPRPYDVEKVSRQTAQTVLASRALPDPLEHQVDSAVSPAFMNNTVSSDRSTSTKEFANSVRERPSLLQSALARHKVHVGEGLSATVDVVDGKSS